MGPLPTFAAERPLWRQGCALVAGVDEVGRGPLAGPVAAAAVVLPPGARFRWLSRVRDSKQLTAAARAELAEYVWRDALAAAVAFVPVESIDRLGIAEGVRQAMLQAIDDLTCRPQHLLIDGFRLPASGLAQTAIVGGDALCRSIACASIIAKVARDGVMAWEDGRYPGYGFRRNKGYATPEHLEALREIGPSEIHRRSFSPVREMVAGPQPLALARG